MTDLSVAHRAALAHLADSVSDKTLKTLAASVATMPGEKARSMAAILASAEIDRVRRTRGLAALVPMFGAAPDGIEATRFPAAVLPRLWKVVATNEAGLIPVLDQRAGRETAQRVATVCARLLTSAAAACRDQPDVIWPGEAADPGRTSGIAVMASAFDLGGLVQRSIPSLTTWIGRPDADQTAEYRLIVRDAAAFSSEGSRLFLEILSAHLGDTPRTMRLIVNSSEPAARESFLVDSELATLIERLIAAGEYRAVRLKAWTPTLGVESFQADLGWITDLLTEAEITLRPRPDGRWGKRLNRIRTDIAAQINGLMARVTRTMDTALPMVRTPIVGRMTRDIPRLDTAVDADVLKATTRELEVLRTLRNFTGPFGCEAARLALVEALTTRLAAYAELALEEINHGVVESEAIAVGRIEMAADFLDQLEAQVDARSVRRRVAAAAYARHCAAPSPKAD